MAILIEPPQNELSALQNLSDSAGFLKKTGDGSYSIDTNSYLPLSGGTVTGVTTFSNTTTSTSPTTGAIVASSLGITGNLNMGGFTRVISSVQFSGFAVSNGGVTVAQLQGSSVTNDVGTLTLRSAGVPNISISASGNSFLNGGNVGINTVSPSQRLDVNGSAKATSFFVGNNQIISSRRTGWTAPTGTATRSTFSTATVTLSQLAERVKALIDDLTAHGLIGA